MGFLEQERAVLERLLPGLDERARTRSLSELEQADGSAIRLFRETRGAALLIASECGGLGASALEAVRVQRAIGAFAPSLAVATTMHHFSIASLLQYSLYAAEGRALLSMIAGGNLLVASGFAEGRSGANVLEANVRAEWTGDSFRLSGSKKPCSLSRSMDLLSAGVTVVRGNASPQRGVVVVLASMPGVKRKPYWSSPIFAAAESDEVILDGVEVPEQSMVTFGGAPEQMHAVEVGGFCWFTLLITASYLGIASGLAERVLQQARGSEYERVAIASELEGVMCALEGLAARITHEPITSDTLVQAQLVRYGAQDAIERAAARSAELLGGLAFIRSADVSYLLAACRALAFHPPSRGSSLSSLCAALTTAS